MLHTGGHILKNLRVSIFNSTRFFVAVVHHQYSHRRKKDDICQNQFTAYVVLAVKRKRQSYIKKKQREHEKETRTKKEAEQSEFRTAGYDMWSRMEPQNEKLMAAMQQLSLKERFVVTEYVLKGKPFKEIAQETGLKEKGVASAYYRSIKKLRAEMGDVK
jgi:RNA polymerase sigma factor (sigma-70 family)